jgi:hypothetical protein
MPEAAPRSRGGATATVSRPQCLAPPWRPQICDATTLAFPATELSVRCQEPALSTMVDFREPRWFTRTSIFIMRSVNWTIPSKIYSCDLGSARPQETRVCEEIRLCHPGFGTPQHRSSLASEEHICGLTSPRTSRRHMVSTASPNRPGATPKAEHAAATPGGCCHKRLPTPPVTLPNVPGRAPWWFSTDDKPSSNNQSTPCATSILKSRRRG